MIKLINLINLDNLNGGIDSSSIIADTYLTAAGNTAAGALNNGGNFWFTVISYLLFVFLIIGGFVFFRKYLLKRLGNVKSGSHMKITDRLIISQDKQIILIEMKNRFLVVGITQQRMETLAEFGKEEFKGFSEVNEFGNPGNSEVNFISISSEVNETNETNENDENIDENNKNAGFFELLNNKFNEKLKTGFDKSNDKNKNEKGNKQEK